MKRTVNPAPGIPGKQESKQRRAYTRAELKALEQELMNRESPGLPLAEEKASQEGGKGDKNPSSVQP